MKAPEVSIELTSSAEKVGVGVLPELPCSFRTGQLRPADLRRPIRRYRGREETFVALKTLTCSR